jgi:hypothetical protein
VITLALLTTACAGIGVEDLDGFEDAIDAAIEELEDSSIDLDEELRALALSADIEEDSVALPGRPVDPIREQMIHTVNEMAFSEECPIVGALSGRFRTLEDDDTRGEYEAVVFRGRDDVIVDLEGNWFNRRGSKDNGHLTGTYLPEQGTDRPIRGRFRSAEESIGIRFGTYRMAGQLIDLPDENNETETDLIFPVTQGVWQRDADGHGVFLGYWAHCDRDRPDNGTTVGD